MKPLWSLPYTMGTGLMIKIKKSSHSGTQIICIKANLVNMKDSQNIDRKRLL